MAACSGNRAVDTRRLRARPSATTEATDTNSTDPQPTATARTDTTDTVATATTDFNGWTSATTAPSDGPPRGADQLRRSSQGNFDLCVARLADPAKRIGSLLVNPGGPGFGGSDFAVYADQVYGQDLLDRFDIIGWDPRGTGLTTPAIDCTDDYDHFYASLDVTPDDATERQAIADTAEEFADDCATKNADIIDFVGTNNSARDMDSIRRALGEETISYFGFSYGSELGDVGDVVPRHRCAAVLDGAADPTTTHRLGVAAERRLRELVTTFLAQCSADDSCEFPTAATPRAFDALMTALDNNPVPSEAGRPDVSLQVALSERLRPCVRPVVAAAGNCARRRTERRRERSAGALRPVLRTQLRRHLRELVEAFQTIYCMDTSERLTVAEEDATAPGSSRRAPPVARHHRQLLLHVLPTCNRPSGRDHRQGCGADLGDGHHGRFGDATRRHACDGRRVGGRSSGHRHR